MIDGGKIALSDGDATGTLKPVVVTDGMECVIKIKSETGITQFTADIVSDVLTPDALVDVGLSEHLDLCAPGEYLEALTGFGLLKSETMLNEKDADFTLTDFLPMLSALGEGTHCFVLTVGDESGTSVKTLTLKTVKK